jgi:hypothetical protein
MKSGIILQSTSYSACFAAGRNKFSLLSETYFFRTLDFCAIGSMYPPMPTAWNFTETVVSNVRFAGRNQKVSVTHSFGCKIPMNLRELSFSYTVT